MFSSSSYRFINQQRGKFDSSTHHFAQSKHFNLQTNKTQTNENAKSSASWISLSLSLRSKSSLVNRHFKKKMVIKRNNSTYTNELLLFKSTWKSQLTFVLMSLIQSKERTFSEAYIVNEALKLPLTACNRLVAQLEQQTRKWR